MELLSHIGSWLSDIGPWLSHHAGYFILLVYLYTLIPLVKDAQVNKSSYVMVLFLSALELAAWTGIWLDTKELMQVHLLIMTCLVLGDFLFDVSPEILGNSVMLLGAAMVLTDYFFFVYGGYPFHHLSIINGLFVFMCVIIRIACNNDRQDEEKKDRVTNGNFYAMVKKYCFGWVKTN